MTSDQNEQLVLAMRAAGRRLTQRRSIRDMEETLAQIVTSAVDTVPAIDAASISMTQHGRIETRHPTTETIRELDEIQSELHEGPCISAVEEPPETGIVVAQDLSAEDAERWPRYARHAVDAGYCGLMSIHLTTDGGIRGALNLYSRSPHAFGEQSRTMAGLFSVQAALLLYGADHAAHLQRAVDSRDLIGQAKGILMNREGVTAEQAFEMLRQASQHLNMKLRDVAERVTYTGEVPPDRPPNQGG